MICGSVAAQTQEPLPPQESQGDSRYASEASTSSGFALDLQSSLTHDNNIFSNNADRQSDSVFQEGAFLNFWKTRPLWSVGLEYRPTILLHETATAFNALNQGLRLDGSYRLRRNLQFQWKESVYYTTGVLESALNEHFSLPTGPPPILNSTLITPLMRELTNQSELDVIYDISRRSLFEVSGNYAFLEFPGATSSTSNLFNTQSSTGSLGYQYRLTRHFTLGFRYLLQNYHYDFGARDDTHSMFVTALWQMGPHVVVSIFGGPSFSRTGGPLTIPSANSVASGTILSTAVPSTAEAGKWGPGAGGTLTLRSDQTVLRFTAQRLITDGGGLLTTVVNAYEGAELRRRLAYGWDLVLMASNARSVALQGALGRGALDTQSGEVALEHSLFENLNMHFEYDFVRQRTNQYVPFAADVDDNRYTVGILYRIGSHKLTGRGRFASPPSD
jgi:hypothetical protein